MPFPITDSVVVGALNPVEGKVTAVPTHQAVNEKIVVDAKDTTLKNETSLADSDGLDDDADDDDVIIITGSDAARHLLPLRDDGDPVLTFRSLFLATCLSGFQAVMSQIYSVSTNGLREFPRLIYTNPSYSSNQPQSPSRGHLSSSLPTFWAKPGPHSFPVVTDTRLDGGSEAAKANYLHGSRSSLS